MMTTPYPAAAIVAPRIRDYFLRHLAAVPAGEGEGLAPIPDTPVLESLINSVFWTSLRREEGFVPKMSLAHVPPADDAYSMRFEQPMALTPHALAKVAPVVERAGIHLGVWATDGELYAWGTTRSIPTLGLVLEIVEPALLVVKHHRGEKTGKYVNVAVLEGDQVKLVDESASSLPDCPALVGSLLGFDSPASWLGSMNVLVQLAVSMRAHGRGGLLLVVPSTSESWRDSMVAPMTYAISPAYRGLRELLRDGGGSGKKTDRFQQSLREVVDVIAGLTAVDGAAVMTDTYELLAFGAKIARRRGSPQVEQVTVTEPVVGGEARTVTPAQLGGTRHLSAAQFVHDQRDAIALVASQDRRFTVFAWSPCADHVHGHQVETLLL
jgi:hypothetical protein